MESFLNPLNLFYISIWWRAHRKSICKEAKLRFAPRQELQLEALYPYTQQYNGHKWQSCHLSWRKSNQCCCLFFIRRKKYHLLLVNLSSLSWSSLSWLPAGFAWGKEPTENAFNRRLAKCISSHQSNNISVLTLPLTVSCSLPQPPGSVSLDLH